jgi:hypothetical protein
MSWVKIRAIFTFRCGAFRLAMAIFFSQIYHMAAYIIAPPKMRRSKTMDVIYLMILFALFFGTLGLVVAVEHIGDGT